MSDAFSSLIETDMHRSKPKVRELKRNLTCIASRIGELILLAPPARETSSFPFLWFSREKKNWNPVAKLKMVKMV